MLHENGALDGMFLVRPNSRSPNSYALTLMLDRKPYHYEIVSEVSISSSCSGTTS